MKHTIKITMLLAALFFLAQVIGLGITSFYMEKSLPYNIERPELNQESPVQSALVVMLIVIIGTVVILLFAKLKFTFLWKVWFFLAVLLTLSISFAALFNQIIALIIALVLTFFKVVKRNVIVHNITELFIYGALAAIFVPVLNIAIVISLLVFVSLYDMFAVWVSKHMVSLAKFQTNLRLFAGFLIPYKKNIAVLGGGDIGFPLLFAGVVFKTYGLKSLIISAMATLALVTLLYKAEKKKYYPAMPFITLGCLAGYAIILLVF